MTLPSTRSTTERGTPRTSSADPKATTRVTGTSLAGRLGDVQPRVPAHQRVQAADVVVRLTASHRFLPSQDAEGAAMRAGASRVCAAAKRPRPTAPTGGVRFPLLDERSIRR